MVMKRAGRALVLASSSRLPYRTLRCAADCFESVFVFGAAQAWPLRLSVACAGFMQANVREGSFGSLDSEAVNLACRRLRIDTVLPSDGETTRWLAVNRSSIAAQCYPVPSVEVFDTLDDKHAFTVLCGRLGVPVPPTVLISDAAQLAAALDRGVLELPAVVKPLQMWGSLGVAKLDHSNAASVVANIDYAPILVQDYVPGRDLSAFFACRGGEVRAAVIYEMTRNSVHFFHHQEVVALASRVIAHLAYDGVIGFDLRERADGTLFFLECNPRFWYRMDAARRVGLNFVALGCEGTAADAPVLHDAWAARPRSLYAHAPWKLDASMRRLVGEYASDVAVNVAMFVQSMLDRRYAHGQAV